MRVVVAGTRGFPNVAGGVERHCEQLYPRLAETGDSVVVFARQHYVPEPIEWNGVRVIPLKAPSGKSTEAFFHTLRAILAARQMRPDVLHIHSVGPSGLVPLARLLGMRVVVTLHAEDYLQTKWGLFARAYLRFGEAMAMRLAQGVIAVSKHYAESLLRRYGRPVEYIPNGPGISVDPGNQVPECLDGIDSGRYVLFVGRLIPDKRVEDLIEACALEPRLTLVVVGGSSHTDAYAEALHRIAGSDVRFLGERGGAELAALYVHAGVFCLPSAVEGMSMSLVEAMTFGIPIVASDIPANREVLDDGSDSLVQCGDVSGLRQALDAVLGLEESQRASLSQALKGRAESQYAWAAIAARTHEVYVRACKP